MPTDTMPKLPLYQAMARMLAWQAIGPQWGSKRSAYLEAFRNMLPHGSGIDSALDISDSEQDRLEISFSFHHMNDAGYYDGWTEHTVIVTPSLTNGFDMRITGRNRNEIKEYLHDCFNIALREMVDTYPKIAEDK